MIGVISLDAFRNVSLTRPEVYVHPQQNDLPVCLNIYLFQKINLLRKNRSAELFSDGELNIV